MSETDFFPLAPGIYRLAELYTLRYLTADPVTGHPLRLPAGYSVVEPIFNANKPETLPELARWRAWDVATASKGVMFAKNTYEFRAPKYLVHDARTMYESPIVDLRSELEAHAHASALRVLDAIDLAERETLAAAYASAKQQVAILRDAGVEAGVLDNFALRFGRMALGLS